MKKLQVAASWMTGIADEGSADIASQIDNHRILGWRDIELRNVGGVNVCEMSDKDFDSVYAAISESGFGVISLGSAIANWARPITTPFERDVDDLKRSIPRMRRLKTRYIRIMSYPNDGLPEKEWRHEALRRLSELATIAEGEGIVLVHENCDGWASMSPGNLADLLSTIVSPALKIVFDSGNPVAHGGDEKTTMDFFDAALPWIVHFHIKDCSPTTGGTVHTYPGLGSCGVENLVRKLLDYGYEGLFSIEPHMATQVHLGGKAAPGTDQRGIYMEYGKRAWELVARALI